MCTEDADGMANSVDPDQTAARSSLIWGGVYIVCPDLSVQKFRNITVITCIPKFRLCGFSSKASKRCIRNGRQCIVDEKAMIRNRYNRIPHLALNAKWEGNTLIPDGIK